jgi:esterase/lipase superfamily enzyme
LITFLFPVIIYIILKVSMLMKWILYWIVLATGILFLLDTTDFFQDKQLIAQYVFAGFVLVELVTFFVYIWILQIYPNLVLYFALGNPNTFWDIKPLSRPGFYTCKPTWGIKRRKTFFFDGEVDDQNRPTGLGKWISEWSNGEVLTGFFLDGYPMAPFKSREYRTGYSFSAVRIGFVTSDKGGFKKSTLSRNDRLRYGVAGVECSTSGRFFSDLPHAELILDPYKSHTNAHGSLLPSLTMTDCLNGIFHFNDLAVPKTLQPRERIVIEYSKDGFHIPGYALRNQADIGGKKSITVTCKDVNGSTMTLTNRIQETALQIDGWVKEKENTEALLYVPGFNASVESAMETLGQMLTLGNMPFKIKPVIFGWPGGTLVFYGQAIKVASAESTALDFIQVIRELGIAGIKKVHIVCHSMGARIVTHASHHFQEVFSSQSHAPNVRSVIAECEQIELDRPGLLELASVTFLNPETSLNEFRDVHFDLIRNHTAVITMYGNENDIALKCAEWLLYTKLLGIRVRELDHVYSRDSENQAGDYSPFDMDVIDTTALDMNIHAAKHSYFNLNKYIIDDLIDLISNTRRAVDRDSRLLNIDKNVYCFLSAPSYVVNK